MDERPLGSSYLLDRQVGEGASGQVWLGRDRAGRPRAVKLLRHELAHDASVVQRFVQERSLLESIHHPNVVQVHDLVVEGGTLAIVMDYVDGPDLATVLSERGTLAPLEVVELGRQIAAALHAAHSRGVVHRDVKPANVLVETATGQARITDFGIAKIVDTAQHRTMLLGTPLYLAPELVAGEAPTGAADVYSLGLTLYELLCGVPAFDKPSQAALLRAHAEEDPGRPDGIPDRLWALLTRMLAKDPAQRPTAAAVADALRAVDPDCRGVPPAPRRDAPPPTVPFSGAASAAGAVSGLSEARDAEATVLGWPAPTQGFARSPGHATPPLRPDDRSSQETSLGFGGGPYVSGGGPYASGGGADGAGGSAFRQPAPYGGWPPAPGAPPARPVVPATRGRGRLVVAVVAGLLLVGGAVAAGMRLASAGGGTGTVTGASGVVPATAGTSTSPPGGTTTASTGPSTSTSPTSSRTTSVTSARSEPTPTTRTADVPAPDLQEADGVVMDYSNRLVGGSLTAGDMPRLFTEPIEWYQVTTTRSGLYHRLEQIDLVKYRQTYESPRYTTYVGPLTYQGQPAARISYLVSYHKPHDSGTVKVTYTVVRGADGRSRIAAVSEQPV